MLKQLLTIFLIFLSVTVFSQDSYIKKSIHNGDTITGKESGKIYWKLKQDVVDYIIVSTLTNGKKETTKYPVSSRQYEGAIKEYVVMGKDSESFTIQFNLDKNTVTYIYSKLTLIHMGRQINFDL